MTLPMSSFDRFPCAFVLSFRTFQEYFHSHDTAIQYKRHFRRPVTTSMIIIPKNAAYGSQSSDWKRGAGYGMAGYSSGDIACVGPRHMAFLISTHRPVSKLTTSPLPSLTSPPTFAPHPTIRQENMVHHSIAEFDFRFFHHSQIRFAKRVDFSTNTHLTIVNAKLTYGCSCIHEVLEALGGSTRPSLYHQQDMMLSLAR